MTQHFEGKLHDRKTTMATRITHYYFSAEIALKQRCDDHIIEIFGIQTKFKQNFPQINSSNFKISRFDNSQKWNSNMGFISKRSQLGHWPINCKKAFQSLAL